MAPAVAPVDVTTAPTEYVGCALCGTRPTVVVATQDRYGLPTRVVRCVSCGLRFINPRMTPEAYAQFYQHGYRPLLAQLFQRTYTADSIQADQMQYARDLAQEVAPWMPRGGTLVDVGGSTGIVARHFRDRFGLEPTVIDPAPDELARATGCHTICASAEDAVIPPSDVALLCRTIDHLLDPLGVLVRLRRAAGVLVVDALDVDRWPERWRYKVDHPYAFTRKTFHKLIAAAGWHPVHTWTRRGGKYVGLVCSPQE